MNNWAKPKLQDEIIALLSNRALPFSELADKAGYGKSVYLFKKDYKDHIKPDDMVRGVRKRSPSVKRIEITEQTQQPRPEPKQDPWFSRWINTGTLWLIALVFGAVGLALNVKFYFSCGHDVVSSWLLAFIGGANDLATMTLPTRASILWREKRRWSAIICSAAFGVCVVVSGIAGATFSSGNLGEAAQASTNVIEHRESLKAEQASLERDLAKFRDTLLPGSKTRIRMEDRLHNLGTELAALPPISSRSPGEKVSRLLGGLIRPETIDILLIGVLALLPALGGLFLWFARR